MLLTVIILLIVCGALAYIIGILPIDATYKRIAQVVLAVVLFVYLLKLLLPAAGL